MNIAQGTRLSLAILSLVAGSAHAKRIQISPDFFLIEKTAPDTHLRPSTMSLPPDFEKGECRARLREITCLVDPVEKGKEEQPRVCLEGGERYAAVFENLYDHYHPAFQKMFCSLTHIYIERNFWATAYAGQNVDPKTHKPLPGAIMGIRQSLLDTSFSLSAWASWKEQLSFGGVYEDYKLTPGLPLVEVSTTKPEVSDFVYFVISHEFGHLFDFGNSVNRFVGCENPDNDDDIGCATPPESWSALSWQSPRHVLPEHDFTDRASLCFYTCDGHTPASDHIERLYTDLYNSNFISAYGATNPWDDFAEAVAYYQGVANLGLRYSVVTGIGTRYDMAAKLALPQFREKLRWVEGFFKSEIHYP